MENSTTRHTDPSNTIETPGRKSLLNHETIDLVVEDLGILLYRLEPLLWQDYEWLHPVKVLPEVPSGAT